MLVDDGERPGSRRPSPSSAGAANVAPCATARCCSPSTTTSVRSRSAAAGVSTHAFGIGRDLVERVRFVEAERTDAQPAQLAEVRAPTERGAEICSQCAHVGSTRTVDPNRRFRVGAADEVLDHERVDPHVAAPAARPSPPPGPARRACGPSILIADTIGGICSMSPTNAPRRAARPARRSSGISARSSTAPDGVERVGRDAEHDAGPVRLPGVLEVAQQPGRAAEARRAARRSRRDRGCPRGRRGAGRRACACARRRRATCAPPACRPPPVRRARTRR